MFLLDKNKFVNNFLPPRLRKPKQIAWIKVLVWHVFELWNEVYLFYILAIQELFSTNVCTDVFQQQLRNLYPDVGVYKCFVKNQYDEFPTMYVEFQGEHGDIEYCYHHAENMPSKYVEHHAESVKEYDYIIIIPTAYLSNTQAIEALCNKYRPAGKRYLLKFENLV